MTYVKVSDLSPQERERRRQKHKQWIEGKKGCVVCRKPVPLIAHKECLAIYERAFNDGYNKAKQETSGQTRTDEEIPMVKDS